MKHIYFAICMLLLVSAAASAQQAYTPSAENLKNRQEFQDMKFGVFIHWGIYSMMADGEWIMNNNNINWQEYARLADGFYPSKYDAAKWVSDVKAAGAKYICITSRHHDGFSMFATKQSAYNIVDGTPFKRDIIKELADECHKQGIKLHFYYSQLDWSRADYFPLGRTGRGVGRTEQGNWNSYHQFMINQLTELLTNYGIVFFLGFAYLYMLWLYRLWRAIKMNPENRHYYEMYFFALLMFLPPSILPSSIIWEHHYWILFAIINEISHPDNWMPRQYEQI